MMHIHTKKHMKDHEARIRLMLSIARGGATNTKNTIKRETIIHLAAAVAMTSLEKMTTISTTTMRTAQAGETAHAVDRQITIAVLVILAATTANALVILHRHGVVDPALASMKASIAMYQAVAQANQESQSLDISIGMWNPVMSRGTGHLTLRRLKRRRGRPHWTATFHPPAYAIRPDRRRVVASRGVLRLSTEGGAIPNARGVIVGVRADDKSY